MVNSVAQQLDLIRILMGQALTTLLWILGYSTHRITFDIFGKRCDRVIPKIEGHNPIYYYQFYPKIVHKFTIQTEIK